MCDGKHKQRINLKCLFKPKKIPTECYKLLKETYGDNSLFRARVFQRCKRFSEDPESTKDDQRPGRPISVSISEKVTKINAVVRENRRMSIRMVVETVNADKDIFRKISYDELNMKKGCGKMVLKNLSTI